MDEKKLPSLHIKRAKNNSLPEQGDSLPSLSIQRKPKPSYKNKKQTSSITSAPAYQKQERHQPEQGQSRLGKDIQTGQYVDVPQASRRQGLYIIGIQGTGKSVLIENMIIQDIKQDRGVGLLDPHGDLTQAVLSRLPPEREKDVIYLDLTEYHYPFGINLFTCADPANPAMVSEAASKVMHIFKKLWGKGGIVVEDAWGVLLEEILWNATYSFLEASKDRVYTMAEIPLLLTDSAFRNRVVNHLTNRHVKNYWLKKYNPLSEKDQREETRSTLNRVNAFLTQPLVEYIVGQAHTTIDFRAIMDQGKILLFKLSKRHEAVTALIGSMVIAELLNAAYSRADLPVNKRKQFNLYADEFQNFATDDFATLLEEARKFGIGITIAHQNRGQLGIMLKDRIRSVANLVVFNVNSKDAEELAGEFDITPQDAWVEVRQPQQHRRVEEQITDYVEEDIEEISQNPVDFLLSARSTHSSAKVLRAANEILTPFVLYPENEYRQYLLTTKSVLNRLLVDVMEGRLQLRTTGFADRVAETAFAFYIRTSKNVPLTSWPIYTSDNSNISLHITNWLMEGIEYTVEKYAWGTQVRRSTDDVTEQDISNLLHYYMSEYKAHKDLNPMKLRRLAALYENRRLGVLDLVGEIVAGGNHLQDAKQKLAIVLTDYFVELAKYCHFNDMEFEIVRVGRLYGWSSKRQEEEKENYRGRMTISEEEESRQYYRNMKWQQDRYEDEDKRNKARKYKQAWPRIEAEVKARVPDAIGDLVSFVRNLVELCEGLVEQPIKFPTGQKRMIPRKRTQVNWLTDESEKIQHPQRSYADMLNEVASQLTNLPVFTAQVSITKENGRAEHTIRTLDPKQQPEKPLFGQPLQDRITTIKEQNIQDGYVRDRTVVEAEIIQRQEDEPPISRRPPR